MKATKYNSMVSLFFDCCLHLNHFRRPIVFLKGLVFVILFMVKGMNKPEITIFLGYGCWRHGGHFGLHEQKHFPPLPKTIFSCKFCEESDLQNTENVLSTNMTPFMWLQTKNIGLRTLLAREERSLSRYLQYFAVFFYVLSFFNSFLFFIATFVTLTAGLKPNEDQ